MARIHLTTEIAAPPEVCFELALDVGVQASLDDATQAIGEVRKGSLQLGGVVTWRARHFGVVWHMTSRIVEIERPHRFADQMQRGPFSRWRHVHTFEPNGTGTRMTDVVDFKAPLGPLGRIVDAVLLERYMTQLLAVRNRRFKTIAEAAVP